MDLYAQRRQHLAQSLGDGGVAVIATAPPRTRNKDSEHPYRFDSSFYYLTGFSEPHAVLFLNAQGQSVLFCQPKDESREIWDGYRLGPEKAPAALGLTQAFSIDELERLAPLLLKNHSTLWSPFDAAPEFEALVQGWLAVLRGMVRSGVQPPQTRKNLSQLVDEMRLIKDASEIDTMRAACDISSKAHVRAMQLSASRLRAGLETREFHLEAELLHVFRQHGAEAPAYTSIVAAGANACVLHYRADRALVQPGELVLIDAGCELGGYASDITRTFPANGVFSGAQRDLYALVLLSQEAAIAHTRVGARFSDPHDASVRVLAQGLLDLGILNPAEHGSVDDVIDRKLYTPFYMHRTSHWLGLDVHDCGAYVEEAPHTGESSTPTWSAVLESAAQPSAGAAATTSASSTSASLPSRRLQANMVLTIEPGLYVRPSDNVPRAFWDIGIRIEDDAWVTPEGAQLLSRGVPVEIAAIEELMRA